MKRKIITGKCPFCKEGQYQLEKWGDNLYMMTCLNKNIVASQWVELRYMPYWAKVKVK